MAEQTQSRAPGERGSLGPGVLTIALTGLVLGLGYNYLGLEAKVTWGLSWLTDPAKYELESLEFDAETTDAGAGDPGALKPGLRKKTIS